MISFWSWSLILSSWKYFKVVYFESIGSLNADDCHKILARLLVIMVFFVRPLLLRMFVFVVVVSVCLYCHCLSLMCFPRISTFLNSILKRIMPQMCWNISICVFFYGISLSQDYYRQHWTYDKWIHTWNLLVYHINTVVLWSAMGFTLNSVVFSVFAFPERS